MMKTQNYRLLLCLALFMLTACSGAKKEEAADEGVTTVLPDEKNEVTVVTLKRQTFNHELVSNGKVVAAWQEEQRDHVTVPQIHFGDPDSGFRFKHRTRIMHD